MHVLEKNLEKFFNNNMIVKNEEFKSFFYQGDDRKEFKIIYDEQNYIYYLSNIPKEKEYIIKEKIEYEILIKDSSYDILFYKNLQNSINCILIIIINDIDFKITNENYLEFKFDKFQNINDKENIITKIKQKIINYIKEKKENIQTDLENLILEGKDYNLLYNNDLLLNEGIKKLCSIISKVEIKNDNYDNITDNITDNIFMNVYEILSPSYKALLAQNYINEMPQNLLHVMIKYQETNFSKELFDIYKNKKLLKNKNNKKLFDIENKENKKNINNKNKKIIFNLKRINKNKNKKKKFKVILKQMKPKIEKIKKINIKKNIFQIHKKNDIDILQPIIEIIKEQKNNNITNIVNNKKTQIFKCVNVDTNPKKCIFFINK